MIKKPKKTKRGPRRPGPGRPPGCRNKVTRLLKEAILEAAQLAGGDEGLVGYLKKQAADTPGPFMALLGKVLPMTVAGATGEPPVRIEKIERTVVYPPDWDAEDQDGAGASAAVGAKNPQGS